MAHLMLSSNLYNEVMFIDRHGRVRNVRQRVRVRALRQHVRHVQVHLRQGVPVRQHRRL